MTRLFCPTCRTMKEAMDIYETDDGTAEGLRIAAPLECGHDATDGGGRPYKPKRVRDRALVEQVVALQEGAK